MKRQFIRISLVAGLLALFMPVVASAQSWPWPDNRDRGYGHGFTHSPSGSRLIPG